MINSGITDLETSEEIKNEFENLSTMEHSVITLLFGLDAHPRSPEEIALLYCVTEDRILEIVNDIADRYPELIDWANEKYLFNTKCTDIVGAIINPDIWVSYNAAVGIMNELLSESSERDRNIILLRFGLKDCENKSLRAVGKINKVSGECVRHVEMCAIAKIKAKIRKVINEQKETERNVKLPDIANELLNTDFEKSLGNLQRIKYMIKSYPVKEPEIEPCKNSKNILAEIEKMFAENEIL